MSKPKLFVFMVDALCESDVAYMRTLKNFGWMLENGALVREMLPVYPSFTYPCHVSIMTGCYPEKHGIPHNEQVKAGVHPVPWYISRKLVQKKFFAEYAKERGLSTCLVNWPVSAGADQARPQSEVSFRGTGMSLPGRSSARKSRSAAMASAVVWKVMTARGSALRISIPPFPLSVVILWKE